MRIAPFPNIVLVFFCMAGGFGGYFLSGPDNVPHHILVTLESSVPLETQLYYDSGKGFNEDESIKRVVYQTSVPVTLDFDIPGSKLSDLRFDPSRSHARIKIFEILIRYHTKGASFAVPLDSLMAARDIRSLQFDGKALTVETTKAAQDPILLLGRIGQATEPSIAKAALFVLGGALASLAVAFLILWVYQNSSDSKELIT